MLYYEILSPTRPSMNRPSLEPGIYKDDVRLDAYARLDVEIAFGIIAYAANRIWREQDNIVDYIKHKNGGSVNWKVDMTEFAWIKLKAKVL